MLSVDIGVVSILLDELPAGRDIVTHQHAEGALGFGGVFRAARLRLFFGGSEDHARRVLHFGFIISCL